MRAASKISTLEVGGVSFTALTDTFFAQRRLRVRRIDESHQLQRAIVLALREGRDVVTYAHGGEVANAYRYPASTEACVVVVLLAERMALIVGTRVPANKVSYGGVVVSCAGKEYRAIGDARFSQASTKAAQDLLLEQTRTMLRGDLRLLAVAAAGRETCPHSSAIHTPDGFGSYCQNCGETLS